LKDPTRVHPPYSSIASSVEEVSAVVSAVIKADKSDVVAAEVSVSILIASFSLSLFSKSSLN